MDENKSIKVSLGTVVFIFIIILLVIALGIVYYLEEVKNKQEILALKDEMNMLNHQNDFNHSENITVKTDNANADSNTTKVISNNAEVVTEMAKKQIEEYIVKIYPIPSFTYSLELQEFNSIKNANQEWIWSTSIRECQKSKENVKLVEINEMAKKLYGDDVGELKKDDFEYLSIIEDNNNYYWIGDHASIEDQGKYRIINIYKENDLYKVEIAQYTVHSWSDGVRILDKSGNTLKIIVEGRELNEYDNVEEKINNYINNNIDKLDKVVLTIEYDKADMQYHVISIENK